MYATWLHLIKSLHKRATAFPIPWAWDRWLSTGPAAKVAQFKQKHGAGWKDGHTEGWAACPCALWQAIAQLLHSTGVWWDGQQCSHTALGCSKVISAAMATLFLSQISTATVSSHSHTLGLKPSAWRSQQKDLHLKSQSQENLITRLIGIWGHWLGSEQKFQLWWIKAGF